MNDDRDLDEMLASLDALLREEASHNDDMPAVKPEDEIAVSVDPVVLDESSHEEALADVDENDNDAVLESVPQATLIEDSESGEHVTRVVLTEAMMVENPQVSLPLGSVLAVVKQEERIVADEVDEAPIESELEDVVCADDMADEAVLHEYDGQLAALVSQDVLQQLQTILPSLIEQSLHTHLSAMQNDNKKQMISDDE